MLSKCQPSLPRRRRRRSSPSVRGYFRGDRGHRSHGGSACSSTGRYRHQSDLVDVEVVSAEGSAAEGVDLRGRARTSPRRDRQASVIPAANPLASPPTISTVDGGRTGPPATNRCQPRQAWKGAAVAADSGAGVRLVGPPPSTHRRGVRAVEGARLESVYGLIAHRGFESLPLRHLQCVVR